MRLRIRRLAGADFTGYACVAHNALGQSSGSIVLNALRRPATSSTTQPPPPPVRRRRPTSTQPPPAPPSQAAGSFEERVETVGSRSESVRLAPPRPAPDPANWWLEASTAARPADQQPAEEEDEPYASGDGADSGAPATAVGCRLPAFGWLVLLLVRQALLNRR